MKKIDAKPLWYENYYDGPLDGMCEVDGVMFWYRMADEIEDTQGFRRVFEAIRLGDDSIAEIARRHKVYQEVCGYSMDFGAPCDKQ